MVPWYLVASNRSRPIRTFFCFPVFFEGNLFDIKAGMNTIGHSRPLVWYMVVICGINLLEVLGNVLAVGTIGVACDILEEPGRASSPYSWVRSSRQPWSRIQTAPAGVKAVMSAASPI